MADDTFAPNVMVWIQGRATSQEIAASVAELAYDAFKPSRLLDPVRGVVQFTGRTAEITRLIAWCEESDATRLRLITGPAGIGKTRLALQLMTRMAEVGWHCISVSNGREGMAVADLRQAYSGRVLLVIDYAETRLGLPDLLHAVANDEGLAMRVLLLARSTGEWWDRLSATESAVRDLVVGAGPDGEMLGRSLAADLNDQDLVRDAICSFASAIGLEPPPDIGIASYSGHASILDLHAAALVTVLNVAASPGSAAEPVVLSGILDELLRHEERFWIGSAASQGLLTGLTGLTPNGLRQIVAVGTLLGAVNENDAINLLDRVPNVPRSNRIVEWLQGLYPPQTGSDEWLGALQPDKLAELLVINELSNSPLLAERCLRNLTDRQARRVVILLARASADYATARHLLEGLLPRVSDIVANIDAPIDTLVALANAIPYPSVNLAVAHAAITKQILDALPHDLDPMERARGLLRLGLTLEQIGHYADAISSMRQAILIFREQGETSLLAAALGNLASFLSTSGNPSAALELMEEALEIYRLSEDANPGRYRAELAAALANYGIYLTQQGRSGDALTAMKEALTLRRELARQNPETYRADVAISLNNFRMPYSSLGQSSDALPFVEEAVQIRRELADISPDHYSPFLAVSLNNLADVLCELGRPEQALSAAQESVDIRRKLAAINPHRYTSNLADSLVTLGRVFAALHHSEEALDAIKEGSDIYRDMAEADPVRYRPQLAMSLTNLGAALMDCNKPTDALACTLETLGIYRDLVADHGALYESDLALCLNNLSSILVNLNRHTEALPVLEEAVEIRRALTAEHRGRRYSSDLAHSLVNLGATLMALGRSADALSAAREAVGIYRELTQANPDQYRDELNRSLGSLSAIESGLGHSTAVPADVPLGRWPTVRAVGPDAAEELTGSLVMTYAVRLPFSLALKDAGTFFLGLPGKWTNKGASGVFGETGLVVIRLCNISVGSSVQWPIHAKEVLRKLYRNDELSVDANPGESMRETEQWVSLETPNVRLDSENIHDDAFTFHRCLEVLNRYLRVHYYIYKDIRVRPITTQDLHPVVFRGAYEIGDAATWRFLGPMVMHPEAFPSDVEHRDPEGASDSLTSVYGELDWHPFLRSADWLRRALYARQYTGDGVDVILSLHISMENMLYRTWGMLLIDQGKSQEEVMRTINSGITFRRLLVSVLPSLLGGRWDINAPDTPVGRYWIRIYKLQESILHGGHQPSWPEAEAAYDAYTDLREFINSRLWERHRMYPRTLLAKVGDAGLRRRGWDTRWMRDFRESIRHEPPYFYLARDLAGRDT